MDRPGPPWRRPYGRASADGARVLLYTSVAAVGGAEVALGNLIAGLSDRYEVHVAGTHEPLVRWLAARRPGLPYHTTGKGAIAHLRLLRRLRPDLVQINLEVPWASATMLGVALAMPWPRVIAVEHMTIRTVDLGILLRTRALALRLDRHVAVSADGARRAEDFYALGRGSVQVIYNGVPALAAGPPRVKARAGHELVVGCVGRLDKVKGHDVLIQALTRLPNVRAVIVGSGSQEATLRRLANRLGVADRVEITGWCDHVDDRLYELDIYCQPSRYEGLGLALIEAMRAGLPCVASATGGVPELFDDCRNGVLVPAEDPGALADAINRLATDPASRDQLGRRARERILTAFTTERMVADYESLWGEALITPRAPRLRPDPMP